MQKKLWLPILMILLGINIPIINAASSKDRSSTNVNKKKKSQSKKKTKTPQEDDNYTQVKKLTGSDSNYEEPIKRYQKNINYRTDHFRSAVPSNPYARTDDGMTGYFSANT